MVVNNPEQSSNYNNLAYGLLQKDQQAEAAKLFQKSLQLDNSQDEIWIQLGLILRGSRLTDKALYCFQNAVTVRPGNPDTWHYLVTTLEFANKLDEIEDIIRQGRAHHPDLSVFTLMEAKLARRRKDSERGMMLLEPLTQTLAKDKAENAPYFFEIARLYDLQDRPDDAFQNFTLANHCQSLTPEAQQALTKTAFDKQIAVCSEIFTPDWVKNWNPIPVYNDKPEPVFLVGFPRSGTTLLGRILSSHPDISVAEELPAITNLIQATQEMEGTPYPQNLATLTDEQIRTLRTVFFDSCAKTGVDMTCSILVDKFPLNLARAGLIERIFPGAKFVFALRHPCDCVLSCFMQEFGMNEAMSRFLTLEGSVTMYDKVMSSWESYQTLLPLNIHTVKYEDLVTDAKPAIASLLEFLNVPWNDSVMDYDKAAQEQGNITTPSYSQVTQQLYSHASGRWLRYRKQMEPVLATLQSWIDRYKYSL